jgi:capsular exopolysaccharide synthesis family protein
MAQSGKRVLLVDCDLRRSSVHTIFGIQSKVGLSNVIVDEVELADAVQASPVENLWILPAGPHPPNPSELLTLPRFEQFVDLVRQQYDFVLLDSPPLLAVSDPAVIAPRADGVLLAMRVTKNGRPQAIHARAVLNSLGVQVLGLALNAWHCDRYFGYSSYGRGYGQRYSYGYGYGHKYYGKDEAHEEPDDEAATPLAALLSRVRWVADRFSRRD